MRQITETVPLRIQMHSTLSPLSRQARSSWASATTASASYSTPMSRLRARATPLSATLLAPSIPATVFCSSSAAAVRSLGPPPTLRGAMLLRSSCITSPSSRSPRILTTSTRAASTTAELPSPVGLPASPRSATNRYQAFAHTCVPPSVRKSAIMVDVHRAYASAPSCNRTRPGPPTSARCATSAISLPGRITTPSSRLSPAFCVTCKHLKPVSDTMPGAAHGSTPPEVIAHAKDHSKQPGRRG